MLLLLSLVYITTRKKYKACKTIPKHVYFTTSGEHFFDMVNTWSLGGVSLDGEFVTFLERGSTPFFEITVRLVLKEYKTR